MPPPLLLSLPNAVLKRNVEFVIVDNEFPNHIPPPRSALQLSMLQLIMAGDESSAYIAPPLFERQLDIIQFIIVGSEFARHDIPPPRSCTPFNIVNPSNIDKESSSFSKIKALPLYSRSIMAESGPNSDFTTIAFP